MAKIESEAEKAAREYAEEHAVRTDGGGWQETYDHTAQEAAVLAGREHFINPELPKLLEMARENEWTRLDGYVEYTHTIEEIIAMTKKEPQS